MSYYAVSASVTRGTITEQTSFDVKAANRNDAWINAVSKLWVMYQGTQWTIGVILITNPPD